MSKPVGQIPFEAQVDTELMEEYLLAVNRLFDGLVAREITPDGFVDELKRIDVSYIESFAEQGYRATGGMGNAFQSASKRASDFINSFADNFGKDLAADPNRDWRWRALMYPREGSRLAYVLGQQDAMRERGARAWQRVLHPELSATGPCSLCIEDSMIIHQIEDPFESLHPGEVCTVMESIAYYPQPPERIPPGEKPMVELPTPQRLSVPQVIQMLRDAAASLGKLGQSIIRRIRHE